MKGRRLSIHGLQASRYGVEDLELPLGQLICLCGGVASGAHALAQEVLLGESRRRFLRALSPQEREQLGGLGYPVEMTGADGLPPAQPLPAPGVHGRVLDVLHVRSDLARILRSLSQTSCPDCGDSLRMWEGKWRCWSCGWPDHQSTGHQATYLGGGEKPAGTAKEAWKQQQRQQRVQGKGSGPKDSKKEAKTGCWWIIGIIVFISMIKDCGSGGEDALEDAYPDDPYDYDEAPPPEDMYEERKKGTTPPNSSLPFRNRNATESTTSKGGKVGSKQEVVRVSFNQGLRSYQPKPAKPDPELIAKGKVLFLTKICFTCHQADPAVPSPVGLALKAPKFIGDFWGKERKVQLDADPKTPLVFDPGGKTVKIKLDDAYFLESIEKPFAKVLKGAIPGMAPLPTTPEERKALLAYVKSLSKKISE